MHACVREVSVTIEAMPWDELPFKWELFANTRCAKCTEIRFIQIQEQCEHELQRRAADKSEAGFIKCYFLLNVLQFIREQLFQLLRRSRSCWCFPTLSLCFGILSFSFLLLVPCGCSIFRLAKKKKELKLNKQEMCVLAHMLFPLQFVLSHLYSFQIMRGGLLRLLHQDQNRSKASRNQHLETQEQQHVLLLHMCRQIRVHKKPLSTFGCVPFFPPRLTWNSLSAERKRVEGGELLLSINTVRPFSLAAGLMGNMERGAWRVKAVYQILAL